MKKLAPWLLTLTAICLLVPVRAVADPTIINGSFEAVQIGTAFSANPADIPGWTHTGDVGDALLWHAGPICCGGTGTGLAGDGDEFVTMGGGFGPIGSSQWSQTIGGLTAGQSYVITFMMAAEGETPTQNITVSMTSGSSTGAQTFTSPVTSTLFWQNWGTEHYTFLATGTSATLQFAAIDQPYDVGLDAVSIAAAPSAVPEPSSMIVLGAALMGLAIARKRKTASHNSGL